MRSRVLINVAPAWNSAGFIPLYYSLLESLARQRAGWTTLLPENVAFARRLDDRAALTPKYYSSLNWTSNDVSRETGNVAALIRSEMLHPILTEPDGRAARHGLFALWTTKTADDIHAARLAYQALADAGVPLERVRVVILDELVSLSSDLSAELFKSAVLRVKVDGTLLARCDATGRTILSLAPRSRTAKEIDALSAQLLAGMDAFDENERPLTIEESVAIERRVVERVWTRLAERQADSAGPATDRVRDELDAALSDHGLSSLDGENRRRIRQAVDDHVTGLGPLESLRRDPDVTEIMVNGAGEIYLERRGRIERTNLTFVNDLQVRAVIDRLIAASGRRVDVASPLCDARLEDGSRVNVVLPPVSIAGPIITLRRFRTAFLALDDLVASKSLTSAQREQLAAAVRKRANILVAGNTGAGKTTLLNVLSSEIDAQERIVTLEDAAELRLRQPHVIRLETRPANAEGKGAVTMSELVVNALRMRPDRIIVGECRGAEAVPMIQAMNTGHDGSMTTVHANSATDSLRRLEGMVLLGAPQWPLRLVREQIAAALNLVVFVKRTGERRCVEAIGTVDLSGESLEFHALEETHP
jgi:pilus assembly protein CpaF